MTPMIGAHQTLASEPNSEAHAHTNIVPRTPSTKITAFTTSNSTLSWRSHDSK